MRTSLGLKSILLAATALSFAGPAFAQDADDKRDEASSGNDIVVVARRTEERLQDVPISITVLSSEALSNNNITSAKDIATYTPALSTNNRFGADNTTWTIRGFTQEQRTTATVGTYFADVVAPRGSGATQGGDGAGPGNLFDLQNVQVLKGPQGTLQGRNSTGGAVMLVPKKPTDRLEGYVEASIGDYSMYRLQGVLNVPLADTIRTRIGVDHMKRDGYLQNVGKVGFGPYGDAGGSVDYWAARFSMVIDVTPDIENYTVANWSHSKSTGIIPKITQAFYREPYSKLTGVATGSVLDVGQTVTGLVTGNGLQAMNQMAYEAANCGGNFWCVTNSVWDSRSETQTWQAINQTKWQASDNLTVKAIASYAEFRGDTTLDLFGLSIPRGQPSVTAVTTSHFDAITTPLGVRNFSMTHSPTGFGGHTNSEASMVGELQFQWTGEKLNWQGGFYHERSNPIGFSGTGAASQTPCGPVGSVVPTGAAATEVSFQVDATQSCLTTANQANSLGRVGLSTVQTYYRDTALYWQGIYSLTDQLKLTAGIRYTWDSMRSDFQVINLRYYTATINSGFNGRTLAIPGTNSTLPGLNQGVGFCNNNVAFGYPANAQDGTNVSNPAKGFFAASDALNQCKESHTVKTSAPTWLLGIDFKPSDDVLLYAKYSRGYRQGGVNAFGLDQLQDYGKEQVDTYEVGAKASWRGSAPGYFNISAFHNNFRDQQLQIGVQCNPSANCPQTTVVLNTGKSRLDGFEIEAGVTLFDLLHLNASYAYLNTKLIEVVDVSAFVLAKNATLLGLDLRPVPVGSVIPNAVPHKLVLSGTLDLPVPDSWGKLSVGATMVYTSKYRAVSDPPVLVNCSLSPTGATQTVNTNINAFACGAATPPQFAPGEYGVLPSSKVVNLNVNWNKVGGAPVDLSFFVTNLTNEKVYLHANAQVGSGFVSNLIGEPRMYGFRAKMNF